jgi:hypothetical protein
LQDYIKKLQGIENEQSDEEEEEEEDLQPDAEALIYYSPPRKRPHIESQPQPSRQQEIRGKSPRYRLLVDPNSQFLVIIIPLLPFSRTTVRFSSITNEATITTVTTFPPRILDHDVLNAAFFAQRHHEPHLDTITLSLPFPVTTSRSVATPAQVEETESFRFLFLPRIPDDAEAIM